MQWKECQTILPLGFVNHSFKKTKVIFSKITVCNYFTDSELTNLSFSVIHTLRKKPEISKISSEPPEEILQNAYDNTQSNEQNMDV